MSVSACIADGCPNAAKRRGLCWTHLKRAKRGVPSERAVRGYRMTKKERLDKAIARYANAETDEEYRRASRLVEKYASEGSRVEVAAVIRRTVDEVLRSQGKRRGQPG